MKPRCRSLAVGINSNNNLDVSPTAWASTRPKTLRGGQDQSLDLWRSRTPRGDVTVPTPLTTYIYMCVRSAICNERLHICGAVCTQLASLTDTCPSSFAKPVAKQNQTAVCHNPRVKGTEPRSNARASLRRRRDGPASKTERGREGQRDGETERQRQREMRSRDARDKRDERVERQRAI